MTTPAPAPVAAAPVPGKVLGIVALILTFPFGLSLLGLILGIVAGRQSKAAGIKNTPATVAVVLSIIFIVLSVLFFVIAAVTGGISFNASVGS